MYWENTMQVQIDFHWNLWEQDYIKEGTSRRDGISFKSSFIQKLLLTRYHQCPYRNIVVHDYGEDVIVQNLKNNNLK